MLSAMRAQILNEALGGIDHHLPIGSVERLAVDSVDNEVFGDSSSLTGIGIETDGDVRSRSAICG